MSRETLSTLPEIRVSNIKDLDLPSNKIRMEDDVGLWKSTRGYQNYLLFLRRLSEAVTGQFLSDNGETDSESWSPSVSLTLSLLDRLDGWIDEIPPLPTPQRFGNLAFRTWGKRIEDQAEKLVRELLPVEKHDFTKFLTPYLVVSFGSFTRMDYGTGHETAFGIFLLCLTLIRFFEPEPSDERAVVFAVFRRYLRLCWRLQDVYRLEPAGSHGVWGLDDYSFLAYIFGSAQLRDQDEIEVSAVLHPPLPQNNLYFMSIMRIRAFKTGPFHEHSSQLYAIAMGVPNWGKVHSGLLKMYEAEVLGKSVVVQHIPMGGLLEWTSYNRDNPSEAEQTSAPGPSQLIGSIVVPRAMQAGTSLPSQAIGPSVAQSIRAPWSKKQ